MMVAPRERGSRASRWIVSDAPSGITSEALCGIGITTFVTDYTIDIVTLGAGRRGARVRLVVPARAHPHPGESRRRRRRRVTRARPGVQPPGRPVRVAGRGGRGDLDAHARHRRVAGGAARPDRCMAKQVATLDDLSRRPVRARRRASAGTARRWRPTASTTRRRRDVVREKVLTMKALWRDDEASFGGEHVQLEPSWQWPKPVRGDVPVLIGGAAGPKLFAAICDYADGWIPIGGAGLSKTLPELRAQFEAAGRDPSTLRCVPVRHDPRRRQARSLPRPRHRRSRPAHQRRPD